MHLLLKVSVAAFSLGLVACSSAPTEAPAPPAVPVAEVTRVVTLAPPEMPLQTNAFVCGQQVAAFKARIGQPPGDVRYKLVRVLAPNAMVTMDFNPERLNVYIDDAGNVADARCG